MDLRHRSPDVKPGTVQLPLEEGTELGLQHLHGVRVLELLVMTGQLRVSHDTLHEIFHEHGHLIVPTQPLIVRAVLFRLILPSQQLLSRRIPVCLVNIHWRFLLLLRVLLHENGSEWTFLHVRGWWLRRLLLLDLWNRLVEKLSAIFFICSIWLAGCISGLDCRVVGIVCIVLILLLVWDWLKVPTFTFMAIIRLIPYTICAPTGGLLLLNHVHIGLLGLLLHDLQ